MTELNRLQDMINRGNELLKLQDPPKQDPIPMIPKPRLEGEQIEDAYVDRDFVKKATKGTAPLVQQMETIAEEEEPYTLSGIGSLFIRDFTDERVQKEIIDKLPDDNAFKTFGNAVGPKIFKGTVHALNTFFKGIGYTADGIEAGLMYLQENHPEHYDILQNGLYGRMTGGARDPGSTARALTGDFMIMSQAEIPFVGPVGRMYPVATKTKLTVPADKTKDVGLPKIMSEETRIVELDPKAGFKEAKELEAAAKREAIRKDPTKLSIATTQQARMMESELKAQIDINTAKIANENKELRNELISGFESQIGKKISTEDKNGNLEIDMNLVKNAGQDISSTKAGIFNIDTTDVLPAFEPILQPNKLNGLVALAADFKKRFPDNFKPRKKGANYVDGPTILDQLIDVSVAFDKNGNRLVSDPELLNTLSKYGLSFEEYILAATSSASEAGKVLNKFSQIARKYGVRAKKSVDDEDYLKNKQFQESIGFWKNLLLRLEGVRRGGLVAALKTAFRNAEAHMFFRAPMETVANVFDDALFTFGQEGAKAGAKKLVSKQTWADSTAQLRWLFSKQPEAKETLDYIFKRPELMDKYNRMFEIFSDIQKVRRGNLPTSDTIMTQNARLADGAMGALEDVVQWVNIPNRFQEFVIRRASTLAELQRLVRQEYKIDLFTTLREGKIQNLLDGTLNNIPENAPSFYDLAERAVKKGLSDTYAKAPDIKIFRQITNGLVNTGLTAVTMPFPRFMFNKLELIGQYMLGASIPATKRMTYLVNHVMGSNTTKKIVDAVTSDDAPNVVRKRVDEAIEEDWLSLAKKPLNAKDRERISRNMVGLMLTGGLTYYFSEQDDLPSKPDDFRVGNYDVDAGPFSPFPDMALAARHITEAFQGTYQDWLINRGGLDSTAKILAGAAGPRSYYGTVSPFVEILGGIVDKTVGKDADPDKVTLTTSQSKAFEKAFANFQMSFLQYFQQFFQADRAFGGGYMGRLDTSYDIIPGQVDKDGDPVSIMDLEQRRLLVSRFPDPYALGEAMKADPMIPTSKEPRLVVSLFSEEKQQTDEALNVIFGLNIKKTTPMGRFFRKYGFDEFKIDRFNTTEGIQKAQKAMLKNSISTLYEDALSYEKDVEKAYEQSDTNLGKKLFVNTYMRQFINDELSVIKNAIRKVSTEKFMSSDNKDTQYLLALDAYKKAGSKLDKQTAQIEFEDQNKRKAVLNSEDRIEDIYAVIDIINKRKSLLREKQRQLIEGMR